ncbi:MAG: glycosyltransferase family 1 protein [Planctomycetota bacterium]|nr:MAG: glycosyltransferase family 1 protein [Planctomycetota bacterium]
MKILLEACRLVRVHDSGGIDALWQNLVLELLRQNQEALSDSGDGLEYVLFSAFLNPKHAHHLEKYRRLGATLRHWWMAPQWAEGMGRLGARSEWFAGNHDLLHISEPVWKLPTSGKIVVTFHDVMYRLYPQYLRPEWVDRLEKGTQDLVERATLWLCNSEHTRDQLCKHYGVPRGRTATMLVGVTEGFRLALGQEDRIAEIAGKLSLRNKRYFLFVGSVEPKKNLGVLLDAFSKALDSGTQADLVVAGRAGFGSEMVQAKVDGDPRLAERVQFTGFIDQKDLPFLVAGARCLVLPSRYEGFGIPVVEAMAAGTPVLCSDRGALPEVAGGAASLFDPDDVDGLAERLLSIDGDDALWEDLRRRGLERSEPFTWQRCAKDTLDAYRQAQQLSR